MIDALKGLAGPAAFAAALAAAATSGHAQEQARLRAGEHGSFSRIALDVPDLGAWKAETRGRTLELQFADRDLEFDVRSIFPERRVSRVARARSERTETGTSLFLSLSCDCVADAYEFQPGMLVIDLRAASAATTRETRAAADAPDRPAAPASPKDAPASAKEVKTNEPAVARAEPVAAGAADAPAAAAAAASNDPAPPRAEDQETGAPSDPVTVAEAQRRLLEQLTRAADQGLVDFRPAEGPEAPESSRDAPPVRDAESRETSALETSSPIPRDHPEVEPEPASEVSLPAPALSADLPRTVQLDARTAFDQPRPFAVRPAQPRCPEEALLDPILWRPAEDPIGKMAVLRSRLTGEFDRPDAEAALALARLQTGLGFGAEARQTLRTFAPEGAERDLLLDLAALLDGTAPSSDGPLSRADACIGRVGAWRLAAGLPPTTGDEGAWIDAALGAFAELPVPLRRRVGPGLVEALVDARELDAADRARLLLDRAAGDHGDAWRLALARLALAQGERARAEALLTAAAAGDGVESADAMLALAESRLLGEGPLAADFVADIAATAYALRGDPRGERLLVAEILGRAGRRELGAALEAVSLEIADDPSRRADLEGALRRILEQARASEVGAMNYAASILAHRELVGDEAPFDAARIQVARQLTGIGLANAAAGLLAPPLSRGLEEARLAMAEAEIAAGDPASALKRIDGIESMAAAELRARALAAQGRHQEAYLAIRSSLPGDAPERAKLAWLGSAWADAAALPPDDPRRALAGRMASDAPVAAAPATDVADGSPSLAGARALLDASASVRREVEEALDGG